MQAHQRTVAGTQASQIEIKTLNDPMEEKFKLHLTLFEIFVCCGEIACIEFDSWFDTSRMDCMCVCADWHSLQLTDLNILFADSDIKRGYIRMTVKVDLIENISLMNE